MKHYELKEVDAEVLAPVFSKHPQGSFAQSLPMAAVRTRPGRTVHYLGFYVDSKLVGGGQISIISGRITSADITAGPLLDYADPAVVLAFTDQLRDYAKQAGCVYVTISPYVTYDAVTVKLLESVGWKYSGRIDATMVGIRGNIRWIYTKDLTSQTLENYRDAYAKRHRRYIKNHDPGLSVRRLERDELPLFLDIMKHTAERRHFTGRSDEYFYALYDHFDDAAHFLITELKDGKGKTTPVAGIIFLETNGEVVAFLGGAVVEYANYRGTYLLHDYMIRYAIEKGYKQYNFYGIEGKINDPSSEGYGIYEFKSRFGSGKPVELIGEFVLPINKVLFSVLRRTGKIKLTNR